MDSRFNPDGLILSSAYEKTMNEAVLPYLEEKGAVVSAKGAHDAPLFCVKYSAEQPRGTVVMLHGFTENAFKFSELIYSLLMNHFSVIAYDQRGHGRSWRDGKISDFSLTHVDHFQDYLRDLEIIMDTVASAMPKPWMVFAHSMGGAVASLYLEKHPEAFSRAVLCAPMIQANMGGIPPAAVRLMCYGAKALGKGRARVFVSKPYSGPEDFATSCATGPERFQWYDAVKASRKEFWNNGPTYDWTLESVKVTGWLLGKGQPEKIACPVRLYSAEIDGSVLPEAQEKFISRVKNGQRTLVKNAKHEIYRSTDEVLFPWWHEILSFFGE